MPIARVEIRDARVDELIALSALCLRSKAHWGYDEDFMGLCRSTLTLTAAKLEQCPTRVAIGQSSEPLGVAAFAFHNAEQGPSAEVELLFVEPDAMGMGVGRSLLQDMRAKLKLLGCRQLWILSDPGAEGFYLSQGAERIGLKPSDCVPGRELPWLRLELTH